MWTPPPGLRCQALPAPFPQITLGRATKDNQIDVDLSLEGPAWKISRKQGTGRKCEDVPPGLSLPAPASLQPRGLVSAGALPGLLGQMSWHFRISNLGVLGAF